jgi:uncharacterized integral membrane protein
MSVHTPGDGSGVPERSSTTTDQVRQYGLPAVIAVVALLFVFQNAEDVKFEFLWFDFEMPMWIMLILFAGVGAIVLYGLQRRHRRKQRDESIG